MRYRSLFCFFTFMVLMLGASPVAAHSNVGTLQIADETVGAYQLNVWTTPEVLRPGEILIAALITTRDRAPVLNCHVAYFLQPLDGGERVEIPATNATVATAFSYEAAVQLSEPGFYSIDIEIIAPDGIQTLTTFVIEITAVSPAVRLAIQAIAIVTLVGCLWFAREAYRYWKPRLINQQ